MSIFHPAIELVDILHGSEWFTSRSGIVFFLPDTIACSCESETLTTPQASDARYYVEKMVIELSAEQAAIIHDALNSARKESGAKDRASLLAHIARNFLDGAHKDKITVQKSLLTRW